MSAKAPSAKKQTVAIKVLPDTPPPPPPKPEDKPPPPKEEPKQVMQMDAPKVQTPQQAPAQLKMDGAAGDGPSAFAAGQVVGPIVAGWIGDVAHSLTVGLAASAGTLGVAGVLASVQHRRLLRCAL